jgi:SAM-dependent methyltransferase
VTGFSCVDRAVDPGALVLFLEHTASAETGMKHYALAAHALRRPVGPILDVGCGAGHDLELFASHGLSAVGVDPSAVMAAAAKTRTAQWGTRVVRAAGEALPFARDAFAGCRIERVLMHVDDPRAVLAETLRCVRPGGLATVLETDWTRLTVASNVLPHSAAWLSGVKHPDAGARLWDLLEDADCDVLDRIEELSVWRSVARLEFAAGFPGAVDRAVAAGRVDGDRAARWVTEQRARGASGTFRATLPKVQLIATKR